MNFPYKNTVFLRKKQPTKYCFFVVLLSYWVSKYHSMNLFTHCPNCKSTETDFSDGVRFLCQSCGFVYFHNVAAAVAVVFRAEDKILFTVRNQDPDKGKWDLPGGFCNPDENAEMAACREINEEMGIIIKPEQLSYLGSQPNNYPYQNVLYRTMDIFFECLLEDTQVTVSAPEEIENLIWVKISDIDLNKIGFVSIRNIIRTFYLDKL